MTPRSRRAGRWPIARALRAAAARAAAAHEQRERLQCRAASCIGRARWSVEPALMTLIPESMRTPRRARRDRAVPASSAWPAASRPTCSGCGATTARATPTPFAVVAICVQARQRRGRAARILVRAGAGASPALECLRRELLARDEILNLHSSLLEQDSDLEMLLSVTGDSRQQARERRRSQGHRRQRHRASEGGLAALIVPEKGIALVQASAECADRHLAARQGAPAPAVDGADAAQGRRSSTACCCTTGAAPVPTACWPARCCAPTAARWACWRCSAPRSAPEFTPHHARLTELLARRVAAIIGHSYDALTGLLTRPAFEQRVRSALQEQLEHGAQRCWSALSIDINRLHVINDNYGMHIGDSVIAQLGELIRSRLPPGAIAARISGDRFAVLLPAALEDAAQVRRVAARRRRGARRRARRRQDAGLDQHRRRRRSSRARRSSRMRSPPPRPPARPPRTAAAIASRCIRRPTRASSAASPTST